MWCPRRAGKESDNNMRSDYADRHVQGRYLLSDTYWYKWENGENPSFDPQNVPVPKSCQVRCMKDSEDLYSIHKSSLIDLQYNVSH